MRERPDYKNWVPRGMVAVFAALTALLTAVNIMLHNEREKLRTAKGRAMRLMAAAAMVVSSGVTGWCVAARRAFSYDGKRKLAKDVVEGIAEFVNIPEGGKGLDVGCGSGALTIACAKRNPKATMLGVDRWGFEFASYSKELCRRNAEAEGVTNVRFETGDAVQLDFSDETFDVVTSNYVYHNVLTADRQQLLRETLRVLKKGGTFAIHDMMTPSRFGDMNAFVRELREQGYEWVELLRTDNGTFMQPWEASWMMLNGSALLVGKK